MVVVEGLHYKRCEVRFALYRVDRAHSYVDRTFAYRYPVDIRPRRELARLIAVIRKCRNPVEEIAIYLRRRNAEQYPGNTPGAIRHFLPLRFGILSARCRIEEHPPVSV